MPLGDRIYAEGADQCFGGGGPCGLPRTVYAPAEASRPLAPLAGAAAPPHLTGAGRPPSWEAFPAVGATALPSRERKKSRWGRWRPSCDFCPLPSPSAKPHRKDRVRFVLQDPSGKAANVAVPPPSPFPSPRGWPPCFLSTKWRHVAQIRRHREIGVSMKALECAPVVPSSPSCLWSGPSLRSESS